MNEYKVLYKKFHVDMLILFMRLDRLIFFSLLKFQCCLKSFTSIHGDEGIKFINLTKWKMAHEENVDDNFWWYDYHDNPGLGSYENK